MGTARLIAIVLRDDRAEEADGHLVTLRNEGYELCYIHRGQDPLRALGNVTPLAACFQYDFPDLQGLAQLRATKQQHPTVPLIMITQAHSEWLAVWAFRAGVRDYFVKPVELGRFLGLVRELAAERALPEGRQRPLHRTQVAPNFMPPEVRLRGTVSAGDTDLAPALSYIERNLHEKLRQAHMAELCRLSASQFSRLFKRKYGLTFQAYVVGKRIAEAMKMLHHPKASVSEVCFNVGFRDLSYFSRTFYRYVGETPSQYRAKAMRGEAQAPGPGHPTPRAARADNRDTGSLPPSPD